MKEFCQVNKNTLTVCLELEFGTNLALCWQCVGNALAMRWQCGW
ncbi:13920_t:CDS:1, partial [Racocetra persica]